MPSPPCSAPTNAAGRITIEIHTFTPSVNATTSANVFHRRSATGGLTATVESPTRLGMYNEDARNAAAMQRERGFWNM